MLHADFRSGCFAVAEVLPSTADAVDLRQCFATFPLSPDSKRLIPSHILSLSAVTGC